MTKPKVFVSSTYVDLHGLREALSQFIQNIGYEPVLFEKGGVYFDPAKPLDESCYDAAADADIFVLIIGGRYGSPASSYRKKPKHDKYNSVTKNEYLAARKANIPIYTFVDQNVLSEFQTWQKNPQDIRDNIKFAFVDNITIFYLLEDIYQLHKNNLVKSYNSVDDIISYLKSQLAHLVQDYIKQKRQQDSKQKLVAINPYKLFYYRSRNHYSIAQLTKLSGINQNELRKLEKIGRKSDPLTVASFPRCELDKVHKLEEIFGFHNLLLAGQADDFRSIYIQFYASYKSAAFASNPIRSSDVELFPTKIVVFDFDGTLTSNAETTWERIWLLLGYDIDECAKYQRKFSHGEISHREWCDITRERFKERNLSKRQVLSIAKSIKLIPHARETFTALRNRGIRIHILSGSIKLIIREVLGDLESLIEEIKANDLVFDDSGFLVAINGTRYDYEGKDKYLKELIKDNNLSPLEVLFVGNSSNDKWASLSGARTLCVNPIFTNPDNIMEWTYCIRRMNDLNRILKFIP